MTSPKAVLVALLLALGLLSTGCGGAGEDESSAEGSAGAGGQAAPRALSAKEAKLLLLQLPYRYKWRAVEVPENGVGALAGTATGDHGTVLHFGVALGRDTEGVPVPRAGTSGAYDYSQGGGFVLTDDLEERKGYSFRPGRQFRTAAQWDEAIDMEFEMEEKLCEEATGEPCPA